MTSHRKKYIIIILEKKKLQIKIKLSSVAQSIQKWSYKMWGRVNFKKKSLPFFDVQAQPCNLPVLSSKFADKIRFSYAFWIYLCNFSAFSTSKDTVIPGCNVNGYNGNPHITDKILWSQIFSDFCSVNFPLYNSLGYNSNSDITDKNLVPTWLCAHI